MVKPYNPHDPLMVKAKMEGFRSRSVYKLKELDQKFRLIHKNQKVLDLASAPGSWLQYISQKVSLNGAVVGVDLKEIEPIQGVVTFICDIRNLEELSGKLDELGFFEFDLFLSDVSPNTMGIAEVDHIKSLELNKAILEIAKTRLKKGGNLVMKIFPGRELERFLKELRIFFREVRQVKVSSSRDRSKEIYLVSLNKK